MCSVDLGNDPQWDFTVAENLHVLYQLAVQGLIDAAVGGPPCATWSRLRHRSGGPRPLRFRDQLWGRTDLSATEHDRLMEANLLMFNFWAFCEAIAVRGGIYIKEHPDDPGEIPHPSVWITHEFQAFEQRVNGRQCRLHQCALGCSCRKPTRLSSNILSLPEWGPRCPGVSDNHRHDSSGFGKSTGGVYRSQRLSAYPSAFC